MITRAYQNADGERQEITLDESAWEALSEQDLAALLGFNKPEPEPEPQPVAKPVARRKKSGGQ